MCISSGMTSAMPEGNAMQKLSEKAPALVVTAILLGIIPHALMVLGIRGFAIGLTFFLLNLALCAAGLMTRRFRIFWWCWGVASVALFLLFGMATPVGMLLALPLLMSNWL
jgi:hypothetical protein